MLASNTEACNLALTKIGANTINDIADTTDRNAVVCNLLFQPTLDTLLTDYDPGWSCSIARQQLSEMAADTFSGFEHLYSLPTTPVMLRALMLLEYNDNNRWMELPYARYLIEDGSLHADYSPIALKYVRRITQAADLDTWVGDVLVSALAYHLSLRITEDKQKAQMYMQEYGGQFQAAMAKEAKHRQERHKPAGRWEDIG